jgi:hypothetical protein
MILDTASICPQCQKYLRFDSNAPGRPRRSGFTALKVEGKLEPPAGGEGWEYTMLLIIRDERGEEVARKVVGVGAIEPQTTRTFSLSVEVTEPED